MNVFRKMMVSLWAMSAESLDTGANITRYSMYKRLRECLLGLDIQPNALLAVGNSVNMMYKIGLETQTVQVANYPDVSIVDLPYPDESFDIVISDQVLEHVEGDPYTAVDECHRVLKKGGYVIHTTCFINPVHGAPDDYWRFTPNALKLLHKNFETVEELGGWGNKDVWKFVDEGIRGIPVPHKAWHPLNKLATKNDPLWPIVTWIIAKK